MKGLLLPVRPKFSFHLKNYCPSNALLYLSYKDNNQTRGGLGRVCATGIYRSTENVGFSEIQTEIFLEWKAPQFFSPSLPPFHLKPTLFLEGLTVPAEITAK